jgi:branched-chain amino acid transport system ATP-binding protein
MTALGIGIRGVSKRYGSTVALNGVDLDIIPGEVLGIAGPNGAGKSTLMNTVSGLLRPRAGSVTFLDRRIDGMPPHHTVGEGIAHVLERRRLFPFLSVLDNVLLGAHNPRSRARRAELLARVEALFPIVRERRAQLAHSLSGGEQQLVAIARGLMASPRLLMIDEPFLGLAPRIVEQIGALMHRIRDEEGISILFIEQNVELALGLSTRGYILESGRTILEGTAAELIASDEVRRIFLGDF